jgi:hypothetical protein
MRSEDEVVAFCWDRPATGGHDDLLLRLGGWSQRCDSYYFAIEAEDDGPGVDAGRVAKVMLALLRQWRDRVLQLADSAIVYLPYDFSDQCTGWLRVQRSGAQLEITVGWSSIEGYSFNPSDFSRIQPSDWQKIADAPVVMTTLEEWFRAVTDSGVKLNDSHCHMAGLWQPN